MSSRRNKTQSIARTFGTRSQESPEYELDRGQPAGSKSATVKVSTPSTNSSSESIYKSLHVAEEDCANSSLDSIPLPVPVKRQKVSHNTRSSPPIVPPTVVLAAAAKETKKVKAKQAIGRPRKPIEENPEPKRPVGRPRQHPKKVLDPDRKRRGA